MTRELDAHLEQAEACMRRAADALEARGHNGMDEAKRELLQALRVHLVPVAEAQHCPDAVRELVTAIERAVAHFEEDKENEFEGAAEVLQAAVAIEAKLAGGRTLH